LRQNIAAFSWAPFGGRRTERDPDCAAPGSVPESRFGVWFLNTRTWTDHVLKVALRDLIRLLERPDSRYGTVLDVGCGHGQSLRLLRRAFKPERLIGLDIDSDVLGNAQGRAASLTARAKLIQGHCANLPLADETVDLIFCHQTFHHLVDQSQALKEFRRILKPGGLLLFAESTRAYIHSWMIRLLFRHPMDVQRSADEYLAMVRAHGFTVAPNAVSCPYLWWTRADLGLTEQIRKVIPLPSRPHEETLLNLVAVKVP
jgi:ubiquinone/menaquinone biosynthesis C-methylase UbiE